MKATKKPVTIDFVRWTGNNLNEVQDFTGGTGYRALGEKYMLPTLEGIMEASKDDVIIKGVKGEFYPCKPDIFEATYDIN